MTGGRSVLRIEGSSTPTSRQEPPMSEKPISPLRRRMLQDMSVRRFTPDTQREYIRAVKRLTAFLGRSPDTATAEDLRAFQLHLTATGVQPPSINGTVTALRFFFKVTLDRPETTRHLATSSSVSITVYVLLLGFQRRRFEREAAKRGTTLHGGPGMLDAALR